MWRWLLGIALLLGVALGVMFGALNPETITLDVVAFEWTATLGTVVTLAFAAGIFIGAAAMSILRLLHGPRRGRRGPPSRKSTLGQDSTASDA
jgi:uncharacterized membrane protein YciS (DUF1049 family)